MRINRERSSSERADGRVWSSGGFEPDAIRERVHTWLVTFAQWQALFVEPPYLPSELCPYEWALSRSRYLRTRREAWYQRPDEIGREVRQIVEGLYRQGKCPSEPRVRALLPKTSRGAWRTIRAAVKTAREGSAFHTSPALNRPKKFDVPPRKPGRSHRPPGHVAPHLEA